MFTKSQQKVHCCSDSPIDFCVSVQNRRVFNDDVIHLEDLMGQHAGLHLEPEQVVAVHVDVDLHLVAHPLALGGHQVGKVGQGQLGRVRNPEIGEAPLEVRVGVIKC